MKTNINEFNCLICCSNNDEAQFISKIFLKNGFFFSIFNNPDDVIKFFTDNPENKSKFKFFVIGLDFADDKSSKLLDFLNEIYFDSPDSKLPLIIGLSMFLSQEKIKSLQQKHIVSFFLRPLNQGRIDYELSLLFFKYRDILPQNAQVIIQPTEQELMRGNCKYYEGKHFCVKIVDVSLVGVHIECYESDLHNEILTGEHDFIEHFVFEANDQFIDTDVRINIENEESIFFEFTHFYGQSKNYLIEYILAAATKNN